MCAGNGTKFDCKSVTTAFRAPSKPRDAIDEEMTAPTFRAESGVTLLAASATQQKCHLSEVRATFGAVANNTHLSRALGRKPDLCAVLTVDIASINACVLSLETSLRRSWVVDAAFHELDNTRGHPPQMWLHILQMDFSIR